MRQKIKKELFRQITAVFLIVCTLSRRWAHIPVDSRV